MLDVLGFDSLGGLIDAAVPANIRQAGPLDLPAAMTEVETLSEMRRIAEANSVVRSMIGAGYYGTHTPTVILRNLLENPAWYTAYTPYQPEISQGRLEMLINFQTMVTDLTGMDIANASLLDEGTAAAEAMTLAHRSSKSASDAFLVDADTHPQTLAVLETRAAPLGIKLVVTDLRNGPLEDCFGALLSYPGTSGAIHDDAQLVEGLHERGAVVTVASDLLALTVLRPPGEIGADIVVGSAQRFGVPMGFGGPHAGFMAIRDGMKRSLPGRLVGVSKDAHDRPAYRLTLQTREQHIRREKATSNICTAQVLLANIAGAYAVYHGPEGLVAIAERVHNLAAAFRAGLTEAGIGATEAFFDTVTVEVPGRAASVVARALGHGINLRHVDDDRVGVSFDETTTPSDLHGLEHVFGIEVSLADAPTVIPDALRRESELLTHPVFHSYRSETDMLRYLRALADRDIALDRAMIPLGSCTMKLNATTEMIPVTWPEFANLHPFAPLDQARGYLELFRTLELYLAKITGYDAVSLQPNAGSQGEYAGLLAIRGYHASRGEAYRNVCLIPTSAHGTNPASAAMAGMRVVLVATDDDGNIAVDDLRAKAAEHADSLGAIMVTYPSTHGVFEEAITEVCDIVHAHGGQVYLDGANLNAMVGIAKPGVFGSDVSHVNLHKTFTIPHGGGGPGVGPIGVRAHLAPFLPNHPAAIEAGPETGSGAVSAAPWGSASILPISWAYIRMMGADGLRRATEVAILSANYIAARLDGHYPVLYKGSNGLVAHEAIIDLRDITERTHVSVDDVAKRLIDYGFHAPTMSFPVAGTLMIEPTESEPLSELDRFCAAMIAIRAEIAEIERGEVAHEESALAHAPHTAEDLLIDAWDRPYTREQAAYPGTGDRRSKYWPPVSRIDNAFGDRNIVCACPPIEAWE
jgi:glycine dehydrogenase